MWFRAALIFGILAFVSMVVTEIAREIVDGRRVRRTGVGGTQDINLIGLGISVLLLGTYSQIR
jgi:hypothetical protein